MADTVSDIMTRNPVTIDSSQPVSHAARLMRDQDAGVVLVTENGRLAGVVTDRDITIRITAEERPPSTPVSEAFTAGDLTTVGPDTSIDQAVQLMRTTAVRRLPVVENDQAVGIVSIGDLAVERDEGSALADISAAPGDQ